MKTIIKNLLILTAVLSAGTNIYASADYDKTTGIWYNIISATTNEIEIAKPENGVYSGAFNIPEDIKRGSYTYTVTQIGNSAFEGASITAVRIPNTVKRISNRAFYDCFGLTSVTIPDNVTSIGDYAFCSCSGLTSVTIPNSVTSIGGGAFRGCSGLASVTIGNSVTTIGNDAFSGCSGLTSVTIPNSVTSIGNYAFYECSGLTSIHIPEYVKLIEHSAFAKTSISTITIDDNNSSYSVVDNVLYTKDMSTLEFYPPQKAELQFSIPNTVTEIRNSAFRFCSVLTSVTIPNSVTTIGSLSFNDCTELTYVTIGNSVSSIGWSSFYGCDKLRYLYLSSPIPPTVETSFDIKDSFSNEQYENTTLYVQKESINAYASTEPWCYFKNITYAVIEEPIITINKRNVKISCGTEGAEIYYTLDGSTPDQNSTKYEGPFTINENCTVKAVAFKEFWDDSEIASKEATGIVTVRFKQEENSSAYNGKSQMPEIEANGEIDLSEIDIKAYRLANDDSWKSVPTENVKNTGRYKFELSVDNETTYGKSTAYLTITKAEPNLIWNQTFKTLGVGEKVYLDFSCDNTEFLPVFSNYNEKVIEIGTDIDGENFKWYVKGVGKGVTNLSMSYAECDNYFASETITKIIMVDGNAEIKTAATPTITINKRNVEISCETEGAEIYYTLDGTIPNVNSTKYSGAFKVNENCTVKAIATKESWQDSEIAVNNVTEVVNVKFKQEENTYVYNGSSQMPEIETNGDVDLSEIDIKAYSFANDDYWITIPVESVKNTGRYKFELSIDNETTYGKSTAYLTITKAEPNFVWNQTFDIMNVGKKIYLDFSCDNTESMPVFSNYDDKVIGIGSEIDGNGFKWYVEAIGKGVTNLTMSYAECENYFASETITKTITVVDNAGISDMSKDNIRAYGNDGVIHIANCEADALVNIYTASGTLVYSGTDKEIALEAQGIYIVRVGGQTFKVAL